MTKPISLPSNGDDATRSALRSLVAAIQERLDEIAFADADCPWHFSCGCDPALGRQLDELLGDLEQHVALCRREAGRPAGKRPAHENCGDPADDPHPVRARIAELRDLIGYGAGALTWPAELEFRLREVVVFLSQDQDTTTSPPERQTVPTTA